MFGFDAEFAELSFFRREPLPQILKKRVWSRGEFFRAAHYSDKLLYISLFEPEVNYEFTLAGV